MLRPRLRRTVVLLTVAFASSSIRASTVSPGESLQDAIDHAAEGDVLVLAAGVHELVAPLHVSRSITLRAAERADVVLSGGRRLTLDWKEHAGGVLRAELPEDIDLDAFAFDQLFLDGKRLPMARYPNFDAAARYFGGTAADALAPERIASWRDPKDGFVHSLHRSEWGGDHWRIVGKNAHGTLDLEGGWMNNRPSGMHPEHRFVENIFEELDAPGEWFLDRKARELYLYPPVDVDPSRSTLFASGIERLLDVIGESPDRPVLDVRIEGLRLAHTARTFMKTAEPLLRSDWMIHRGGAIFAENVVDLLIQDCEFRGLGGNGVFVSGFARGVNVRGCHLTDIAASGVCFVGRPEAVRSPSLHYGRFVPLEELDREPGPKAEVYPRDCTIEDTLLHDLGVVEKQVAGVQIAMASRITVRHASIYDVPRAGINIGDGTWGGHLVEGCDVFDTVQMTGDHGSFNSWGRDRYWHPNRGVMDRLTTEHPELILLDAIETTVLRHNRWRCDHGWDIDLDDGSSNYEIHGNLCLGGGIKLREGFHRRVHGNIMVNDTFHPHVWFSNSHDIFEKNIVMTWYRPIRLDGWGDRIDHNLLPDTASLARSRELGLDEHSVGSDPRFIDSEAGDFRVSEDSPALALGFENFPMDRFGVRTPALRAIARTPAIPTLGIESSSDDTRPRVFLGATVKRLRGLGERSAAGLDAERGVLVREVPDRSIAQSAGLRAGDVILRVGGFATNHPRQLQPAYLETSATERCDLTIYRDQTETMLPIAGVRAIRLAAEDARPVGDGRAPHYDPEKDYLGAWTDASASLAWDLPCRGGSAFDVWIEIASTCESAGANWVFTIADRAVEGVTPDTGGWESFRRVRIGEVEFARFGTVRATLTPRAKSGVAVMNLRAVELIAK